MISTVAIPSRKSRHSRKLLEESELKAKVSIRFLQGKELFSFKLADLIISKKRINLSIPIKTHALIMHSIFKPIFAHEK